jgi:monothiol glutaredoxin
MTDIKSTIDNLVKTNDVVLFMKGTADMPMCGFSGRSTQILKQLGVSFKDVNVLDSDEIRQGIKDYTNWPTVPQLYIKGEFVGGADIMMEMFQSGELKQMFEEKGVSA